MVDAMPDTVAALEKVRSEKRGFKKGTYVTTPNDTFGYAKLGRVNKSDFPASFTPISKEDQEIIDKAKKNVTANKNNVLKYVSPTKYAEGAENFNGNKDIFKGDFIF